MSKKLDKNPNEHVIDIQRSCANLHWFVAMNDKKDGVQCLIVGKLDAINDIIAQLEDGDEYEIWADPSLVPNEIH